MYFLLAILAVIGVIGYFGYAKAKAFATAEVAVVKADVAALEAKVESFFSSTTAATAAAPVPVKS